MSETDADTIETFLEARGGAESLTGRPGRSRITMDLPRLVKVHTVSEQSHITVTFQQVFEV